MIVFVTTASHAYPQRGIAAYGRMPEIRIMTYPALWSGAPAPRATYVMTDHERMAVWEIERAARLRRLLLARGDRVLNDPAVAAGRFDLLRRLNRAGVNRFRVWRVDDDGPPRDRFPVFLRTESGHRGVLSELLFKREALDREIERALEAGHAMRDLMVVQYAAEPLAGGVFRKLAAFRVGDEIVPTISVHDEAWVAKTGAKGVAGAELYDEEYRLLTHNPFRRSLTSAFDIARVQYGRADFALVDREPQIYEINTNPTVKPVKDHPYERRIDSDRMFARRFARALAAIDGPLSGGNARPEPLKDRGLALQLRRDARNAGGEIWRP